MSSASIDMKGDLPESPKKGLAKLRENWPFLALISIALLVIAGLATLIVFETQINNTSNVVPAKTCNSAHESYEEDFESATLGQYSKFAVATDSVECASVGKSILEKGGSAVDAAIASGLCNSIFNIQSMGIGGGHFMTIYKKDENKAYVILAREKASENAFKDMYANNSQLSFRGGLAVGIPGELKGFEEAHKRFGVLTWSELFEPTIKYCEDGFNVYQALAERLKSAEAAIKSNKALAEMFIDPKTNQVFKENDTIRLPKLAVTLQKISDAGSSEPFYHGEMAEIIVQEILDNGGNVTIKDFEEYNVKFYEADLLPIGDEYRGIEPLPPSSGHLIPFIINIIRRFDFIGPDMSPSGNSLFYHVLNEAFKHAYAKRTYFGDIDTEDIQYLLDNLRDESYIDEIVKNISLTTTHPPEFYQPAGMTKSDRGTAHLSILAENGDAVALTSTINSYFGAKFAGETTGIIYNNNMDDFSSPGFSNDYGFIPSEANFIKPGKRPLSSMSPTIIIDRDGNVKMISGASGGSKIISGVAQVIIKTLWLGNDLKNATDSRRLHNQLYPDQTELEIEFDEVSERYLKAVGNDIKCFPGGSIVQSIHVVKQGEIHAYSDPRKGGKTDGV